jgi:hypothetical protein
MMRKSVFDRILIEEIKKSVTYVVRDAPIFPAVVLYVPQPSHTSGERPYQEAIEC